MKLKQLETTTHEDIYGIEHQVENFDITHLEPGEHGELYQEGPYVMCSVHGNQHATRIAPGKMLTKTEGGYQIVDVVTV